MADRRPIAEYHQFEFPPDVVVGDDSGNEARAAIDPDTGGWVGLDTPDPLSEPDVLPFAPSWFRVVSDEQ